MSRSGPCWSSFTRASAPYWNACRLRYQPVRLLHGPSRRHRRQVLQRAGGRGSRREGPYHRRGRPARYSGLVDVGGLEALNGIGRVGKAFVIGAMTPHAVVAASPEVASSIPALTALAGGIGDPLVRNRGTMGGSIANADPAAD